MGPGRVEICDVGPRDGFQYESIPIPTLLKLEIIRSLAEAGIPRMQVVSFVHPEKVPQMADAEEVVQNLTPIIQPADGVDRTVFSGLCLNLRGVERAAKTGLTHVDLSIATNEIHGQDNTGMSVDEGVLEALVMVDAAQAAGLQVQLGLQTVFGFDHPGDTPLDEVVLMVEKFAAREIESISLADTTGLANPKLIRDAISAVREVSGDIPLVMHLHDTRGLGLANIFTAWEMGVSRFDTSFGGLGGCPFIKGAAGNVATEDVAYLFESLGVETGIDIQRVAACSSKIAAHLGRDLPGKLYALF